MALVVLELFAGTRSIGKAFEEHGHKVYSVEWDKSFQDIALYQDISTLTKEQVVELCGRVPDVVWASPDCFLKGTPVWTDKGYVNIEDIRCNDRVLTHKGNYKKVYRTIKKNTYHFVKLKIAGVQEFLVTPNHPFYARKKVSYSTRKGGYSHRVFYLDKPEWVEAKDLTTDYRVGIPINKNSKIPKWDGFVREYHNCYGITKSEIINTLDPLMGSKNFWWVVGLYIADGDISKGTVQIVCEKKEDEVIRFKDHADSLGLKYSINEKKSTYSFDFSNSEFCSFLEQFGKGAVNKSITPIILDLPVELLRSFLDGYFSGDGSVDKRYNVQHYSTVSRNLAYGLSMCVLKAYNRYPSVVFTPKEKINNVIEGRTVNVHDSYSCSFYIEDSKRLQYTIEDGMAWVNIKSVDFPPTEQHSIYTLSVEDDESYTAYNIAVHNCTTYSVAAIGHHRKKDPTFGNLIPQTEYARFCDKTNAHVIELIMQLKEDNPDMLYFIENPVAGLRKMDFMQGIPRYTVTYCQYTEDLPLEQRRMKPTDIWCNHPDPQFRPPCHHGDHCHVSAPRGSRTGTQGIKGSRDRARIPKRLCEHIVEICER